MRNTKGGKTSSVVKDRYNKKTYQQVNFRVKAAEYPTKEDIENAAQKDGTSLNAWIIDAVLAKLEGKKSVAVPELAIYAKNARMTEEEYIKTAVMEKMQRQDAEYSEEITREPLAE